MLEKKIVLNADLVLDSLIIETSINLADAAKTTWLPQIMKETGLCKRFG